MLIETVMKGGAADLAGLRGGSRQAVLGLRRIQLGGDVIVSIDDHPVANQTDLTLVMNRKRPGDKVKVDFYRGKEKMSIEATLGDINK